jgi:hypothetical protein
MSGLITKHMAEAYKQEAPVDGGLSSKFIATPDSYYTSQTVEFDIDREGEEVAPVLTDIKDGNTKFQLDKFTNKEFKAPVIKEEFVLNAFDMDKRQMGQDPFQSPSYLANAVAQFQKHMAYGGKRARRNMELQASQIMQDGILSLKNDKGNVAYTLDFKVKASHLPTSAVAWDNGSSTKLADLAALAKVVHDDGQSKPSQLIFGEKSWDLFVRDADVKALLDNRRAELGRIAPANAPENMTYQGYIWVGSYRLDMYTYTSNYKDVGASTLTRYVRDESVIMIADGFVGRKTFGAIPMIVQPDSRVMGFMGGRMSIPSVGMDFTTNAWVSPNGEAVHGSIGTRPLLIPKSIDRFGCLNTGI